MPTAPTYEARKATYATLWNSLEIRPSKAADIKATAQKILGKKTRYAAVTDATSVPWYVVALIHALEGGCNFSTHLHNGDSLANRTVHVPKGRPHDGSAPFTWKDSAIDAIRYDGLDKWKEWSIEGICYCLERYNGFGTCIYHSDVNTPYLWSGTNQYSKGKYVSDGQWSATAVSGQSGAMPILKTLMELDPTVTPGLATEAPAPLELPTPDPSDEFRKTEPVVADPHPMVLAASSRTVWGIIAAPVVYFSDAVKHGAKSIQSLLGMAPDISSDVSSMLSPIRDLLSTLEIRSAEIGIAIGAVCLAVSIIRHVDLKKGTTQ